MAEETAWLVERNRGPGFTPIYVSSHYEPGMARESGCYWTEDHMHAMRFSRKVDAEGFVMMYFTRMFHPDLVSVVEHMWSS